MAHTLVYTYPLKNLALIPYKSRAHPTQFPYKCFPRYCVDNGAMIAQVQGLVIGPPLIASTFILCTSQLIYPSDDLPLHMHPSYIYPFIYTPFIYLPLLYF